MSLCFAYGCNHRALREDCSFYRFPKDKKKFKLWRDMCRRKDAEPSLDKSRLCSCHFKDKQKSNGPTIFPWTTGRFEFVSPEKRQRRRLAVTEPVEDPLYRPDVDISESSTSATSFSTTLCEPSLEQNSFTLSSPERIATKADTDMLNEQLVLLRSEVALLRATPNKTEAGNILRFQDIKDNDTLLRYYTGLPSKDIFVMLLKWLNVDNIKYYEGWTVLKLIPEDQLLLTLVKLRLNLDFTDLAVRFQLARSGVRNIFFTFLHALHATLFPCLKMPSQKKNKSCLSSAFSNFSNCRCIVDCTEIYCAVPPSSLNKQSQTFSYYKHRNTFKGLVACSPHGAITFVSKLYPGSVSDKVIFKDSGIVQLLVPGDLILADKGFLINDVVPPGVSVNVPPFLKHGQLTETEAKITTEIARARIHIARVIGIMKNYNILDFVPANLRKFESMIFQVIACLINLHHPLVIFEELTDSDVD